MGPAYLSDSLELNNRERNLRICHNFKLKVPFVSKKTHVNRSFSVAGPVVWNDIPIDVKESKTLEEFKAKLKTFLYKQFINDYSDYIYILLKN